jgi:hypothetical protein
MTKIGRVTAFSDAYCHLGRPRFGAVQQTLEAWDRSGIERGVLVLGPGVPALEELATALRDHGERVRGIGIPFGSTAARRLESVRLAVSAGAIGCRIGGDELFENPDVLSFLGERGLWAYAIGACNSRRHAETCLGWLDSYPKGRIASPHFLRTTPIDLAGKDGDLYKRLLAHERFHPVLSRHGGASAEPYPHRDLLRWVEQLLEFCDMDRMLWGSEFPCLFWRNETIETCLRWLADLVPGLGEEDMRLYLAENTNRLFFSDPPPAPGPISVPAWVEQEFDRTRIVALLPNASLDVPMPAYEVFLADFLARRAAGESDLLFGPYLADQLAARAGDMEKI